MLYWQSTKNQQLIIKAKPSKNEQFVDNEVAIFRNSSIPGFMKLEVPKPNSLRYTGYVNESLKQRLNRHITDYDFYMIMGQIIKMAMNIQKSNLSILKVVLNLDHIYINDSTRELLFLYAPVTRLDNNLDVISLIEKVVYSCVPSDRRSTFISEFAYFLKSMKVIDYAKVEEYISSKSPDVMNLIKNVYSNNSKKVHSGELRKSKQQPVNVLPISSGNMPVGMPPIPNGMTPIEDDFGGTMLLDESLDNDMFIDDSIKYQEEIYEPQTTLLTDDYLSYESETTILQMDSPSYIATLQRVSNGEIVTITSDVFRLGRSGQNTDYKIEGNTAIGRQHANIINSGNGTYFIMDLNSVNKTYVNNVIISSNTKVRISDGTTIKLADEEFIFRITQH